MQRQRCKELLRWTLSVSAPAMEYLKQLTAELHAETYVRFLGKQTQDYVAAHLTDYDLFVQPSRWEGFGLTVARLWRRRTCIGK